MPIEPLRRAHHTYIRAFGAVALYSLVDGRVGASRNPPFQSRVPPSSACRARGRRELHALSRGRTAAEEGARRRSGRQGTAGHDRLRVRRSAPGAAIEPCCDPCGAADWPGRNVRLPYTIAAFRAQGAFCQLGARSGLMHRSKSHSFRLTPPSCGFPPSPISSRGPSEM